MKRNQKKSSKAPNGITLIELLVVIAIIAILAAMLLPALVSNKPKIAKAKLDIGNIVTAIHAYEHAYNQLPVSKNVQAASLAANEDFTYGTFSLPGIKTPSGPIAIQSFNVTAPAAGFQANNAEIMAVLLDLEGYGNGQPTINKGHVKNTQQTRFLNATMSNDNVSPGIGTDGVYRDPWGTPYIITLDGNSDQKARDAFYRLPAISADPADTSTPKRGIDGLIPTSAAPTAYEVNVAVTVWSAGPDKMVDTTVNADQGANKDNIRSWK